MTQAEQEAQRRAEFDATKRRQIDEIQKPVGSVSVLASEESCIKIEMPRCKFCARQFDPGAGSEYCNACRDERIAAAAASFKETPSRDLDDSILDKAQHVPVSLDIDDDFDDEPLPARTCAVDGEECESCQ